MNLLERRRMLLAMQKTEKWDYVIRPTNPDEQGKGVFPITKIALIKGQSVTIQYEGVTTRQHGHAICDGYYPRAMFSWGSGSGYLLYCDYLTSDNDIFTSAPATQDGTICIGNSRVAAEGTLSQYTAKAIRVRINN